MTKKYKRAGTTSERQDYRKGGQVSKDGQRQKFYPGGIGDGDIGLSNFDFGGGFLPTTVLPEGTYKVKNKQEFVSDYLKENPYTTKIPGGAAGGKVRQAREKQEQEAYDDYLNQQAQLVNKTPAKTKQQVQQDYEKTAGKRPANAPRQRGTSQAQKNWDAGLEREYQDSQNNYVFELSQEIEAENQRIIEENKKKAQALNTTQTGEAAMVSNTDIDKIRKQLQDQATGQGTTMPKPEFKSVEEAVGSAAMEAAKLQTGTGDITQTVTADKFTAQAPRAEQAAQVTTPDQVIAPTVAPTQTIAPDTTTAAGVTAATGQVSDAAQVGQIDVTTVAPIEGVDVTPVEGAVAQRVVAQMSPEAIAEAAEVSGLDVRRVTRAKEELRTAGIDEVTIAQLGNDPKALEEQLMNLTDAQRGLVEGLPEEALVSTQMNTLLAGIEEGNIPTWARPAVAQVDSILAQRGLEASTVGRDALVNTIIQNALPIAQQNAQTIQASIAQERGIEAQIAIEEARFNQQTALQNAQNVFQLNLAQFSADQQTALANSKFLQTVSITNANNDQQATIQNAILLSQANLAQATIDQQRQINNAKSFLSVDLANLNNQQQANVLRSQQEQQVLLSNQAAENAARQFNATSENQRNQFMATLAVDVEKFNTNQMNLVKQFNATQQNAAEARNVQREVDIAKFNTSTLNQIEQFNTAIESNRLEFNAKNEMAIAQSNAQWRRQINTANTAAANAATEIAAKQNFDLTAQAQANLWQDMRDQAGYLYDRTLQDQNIAAKLTAEFLAGQYTDNKALSNSFGVMKDMIESLTSFSVTNRTLS